MPIVSIAPLECKQCWPLETTHDDDHRDCAAAPTGAAPGRSALRVPTLDHGSFTLSEDAAPNFTLVVFYRSLHCPICLKYLLELAGCSPTSGNAA